MEWMHTDIEYIQ